MKYAPTTHSSKRIENEKGSATIEALPLMLVFVMLLSYTLGAFGIIHTGILQSIGARTYAFETFRNRTNLTYFRDLDGSDFLHHRGIANRVHGIMSENRPDQGKDFFATERPIRMGMPSTTSGKGRDTANVHYQDVHEKVVEGKRNEVVEVDPVWVRVLYGICLDNRCGD